MYSSPYRIRTFEARSRGVPESSTPYNALYQKEAPLIFRAVSVSLADEALEGLTLIG
jgi:hypothetical protein